MRTNQKAQKLKNMSIDLAVMSQDMKTKPTLRGNLLEIKIAVEKSTYLHNLTFQFIPLLPATTNVP